MLGFRPKVASAELISRSTGLQGRRDMRLAVNFCSRDGFAPQRDYCRITTDTRNESHRFGTGRAQPPEDNPILDGTTGSTAHKLEQAAFIQIFKRYAATGIRAVCEHGNS
jgi:hypothetical protein